MKLILKIIFLLATLPIQAQISSTIYSGGPNREISSSNHNGQGNRKPSNGKAKFITNVGTYNTPEESTRLQNNDFLYHRSIAVSYARTSIEGKENQEQREEMIDYADRVYAEAGRLNNHYDFDGYNGLVEFAKTILDIATSYTPIISSGRDVYEAIVGRNMITGEEMLFGSFDRNMAIVGAFLGPLAKSIKLFPRICRGLYILDSHKLGAPSYIDEDIVFAYNKVLSELKDTVGFLKRNGVKSNDHLHKFTDAFRPGAKVRVLEEDLKVYRYHNPVFSEPKSNWVTTKKFDNPVEELALEHGGQYEIAEWIIPKGTEVLEGIVAPKWGRAGGGPQIFLNPKDLK